MSISPETVLDRSATLICGVAMRSFDKLEITALVTVIGVMVIAIALLIRVVSDG